MIHQLKISTTPLTSKIFSTRTFFPKRYNFDTNANLTYLQYSLLIGIQKSAELIQQNNLLHVFISDVIFCSDIHQLYRSLLDKPLLNGGHRNNNTIIIRIIFYSNSSLAFKVKNDFYRTFFLFFFFSNAKFDYILRKLK